MPDSFPARATDPTDVPDDLAELLFRVNRRIRRAVFSELGPHGITPAQLRALRALQRCGAPIRMSELADQLGIARRSATSVVDELVARQLVERRPDPHDRRATTVAVTSAGRSVIDEVTARRQQAVTELTAGIPRTDLQRLRATLRRIADADERGERPSANAASPFSDVEHHGAEKAP